MSVIAFLEQFFGVVTLAGIIILTRHVKPFWQIVIGTTLVILGLIVGSGIK